MERKIGEIFEYNGEWYQCVNTGFSCADCDIKGDCSNTYIGACSSRLRKDGKQVRFKKLEKVGEPIEFARGSYFQRYLLAYSTAFYEGDTRLFFNAPTKTFVYIEIKQNKEDMEEKNNGNTPLNVLTDKYVNGDICYDDFEKEVKALYLCKEESTPKLKSFNLEAAKLGKPVCTRDGRKAIVWNRTLANKNFPVVAVVNCGQEENVYQYDANGVCDEHDENLDLMMLPEKKEGWVNVYKTDCGIMFSKQPYSSKEEALKNAGTVLAIIDTVKVEWEE